MLPSKTFKDLSPDEQEKFLKWLEAVMGPKAVEKFKNKHNLQQPSQGN